MNRPQANEVRTLLEEMDDARMRASFEKVDAARGRIIQIVEALDVRIEWLEEELRAERGRNDQLTAPRGHLQ